MMDDCDSRVQCPYNPSHILYQSRLQTHLVKCKWAHEHPQQNVEPKIMKICRYNSNHHVPAAELDAHHATCKDISTVLRFTNPLGGKASVVPYNPIELPPPDENWDAEEYNATYDPEQHAASAVIIRQKQGVPKSVRKTFRLQERDRINRLREDQESLEKSGKANPPQPKPAPRVNTAFSENSLRQPKSALLGMGRGRIVQSQPSLGQGCGILTASSVLSPPDGMSSPPGGAYAISNDVSSGCSSPEGTVSTISSDDASDQFCNNEDEGFIQVGKKNKKRIQPNSVAGSVPTQKPGSPLINGTVKYALPGQPGKGRGRLAKN